MSTKKKPTEGQNRTLLRVDHWGGLRPIGTWVPRRPVKTLDGLVTQGLLREVIAQGQGGVVIVGHQITPSGQLHIARVKHDRARKQFEKRAKISRK